MKYEMKDNNILKDGHIMFIEDVIKDLNRKSYLEKVYDNLIRDLRTITRGHLSGHPEFTKASLDKLNKEQEP